MWKWKLGRTFAPAWARVVEITPLESVVVAGKKEGRVSHTGREKVPVGMGWKPARDGWARSDHDPVLFEVKIQRLTAVLT